MVPAAGILRALFRGFPGDPCFGFITFGRIYEFDQCVGMVRVQGIAFVGNGLEPPGKLGFTV